MMVDVDGKGKGPFVAGKDVMRVDINNDGLYFNHTSSNECNPSEDSALNGASCGHFVMKDGKFPYTD